MKLHLPKEDWKNRGLPPPIYYKADVTTRKTPTDKLEYFKAEIKNKPGERDNKTVAIYVPLFWTGSPEALLKLVTILHNIIRDQDLSIGPQTFGMKRNLVVREAIRFFEQKDREGDGNKHKL